MNKDIVQGHWRDIKGKLKQKWGNLTDDDITSLKGTRESLVGKLQTKYGYQKDQVEKEIDDFLKQNGWDE